MKNYIEDRLQAERVLKVLREDEEISRVINTVSRDRLEALLDRAALAIQLSPRDTFIRAARIDRVVDGDTVDLFVDMGQRVWKRDRYRLSGIDTPERGQENYEEAGDLLAELIKEGGNELGHIWVRTIKHGKFRWMADLYTWEGGSINQAMIESGLAVPYHGGKKGS